MKLIISVALLFGLALADSLPAGTVCDNNNDCNKRCLNSQWTISNQDGENTLVCDPALVDTPQYYTTGCYTRSVSGLFASSFDPDATRVGGSKLGARMCRFRCLITGKKSTTDEARTSWTNACSDAGSGKTEFNDQGTTEAETERAAGCNI